MQQNKHLYQETYRWQINKENVDQYDIQVGNCSLKTDQGDSTISVLEWITIKTLEKYADITIELYKFSFIFGRSIRMFSQFRRQALGIYFIYFKIYMYILYLSIILKYDSRNFVKLIENSCAYNNSCMNIYSHYFLHNF